MYEFYYFVSDCLTIRHVLGSVAVSRQHLCCAAFHQL